jgi:membrane-bound serine protease (ClpP class)
MDWTTIGGLILAGFVLLGLETVLPGMIAGILGAICLLAAVVLSLFHGPVAGMLTLFGVFLLLMLAIWLYFTFFPKSKLGKSIALTTVNEGASTPEASSALVGTSGTMASPGRPAGIALIQGKRLDVVAETGFLENGAKIIVISAAGNRIVVRGISS